MAGANAPSSELGAFLRACRERTAPRDVGLPDSGRRRTPGLRREEVATLAGVSVDYLVRLEQGRDLHPSADVLAALAEAMRLTDGERTHLMKLGVINGHGAFCPSEVRMSLDVPATVVALLDALDPTPAYVLSPAADVLAWNRTWAAVVGPSGLLEGPERPNLARFVFAAEAARRAFPEWRAVADDQAGRLRRASAFWAPDEHFAAVVSDLRAVPDFAVRWDAHPVAERRRGELRFDQPEVGPLALAYEVLELPDAEQQLVSWLPADDESAVRLGRLAGSSRLRLVQG